MMRAALCSLISVLVASISAATAQPIKVFVAAEASRRAGTLTEADRIEASAAYKAADTARKDLEKALKTQYGNKRDKWPADAQERLLTAEETRYRVNADWQYRRDAEPVTKDWQTGIAKALTQSGLTGRKKHITSVASADRADLIVTLTDVRNPGAANNSAADRCAIVRLSRGPGLAVERFAGIPRTYRPRRAKAARLAGPDDTTPFWQFEGCGLHPYFDTEEAIANVVDDFAGAHLVSSTAAEQK